MATDFPTSLADLASATIDAALDTPRPLEAAGAVVARYREAHGLDEDAIDRVADLLHGRLAGDAAFAATSRAWLRMGLRHACGLEPCRARPLYDRWRDGVGGGFAQVCPAEGAIRPLVLDFSVTGADRRALAADADAAATMAMIERRLADSGATVAFGRYLERRDVYRSAHYMPDAGGEEPRSVHLGIDVFAAAGTPVAAPLDGVVHGFENNRRPLDYGPVILLRHEPPVGDTRQPVFYTLYGHLDAASLDGLDRGRRIAKGEIFARLGDATVNGGWAPHLHFQILLDTLQFTDNFPGVAAPSDVPIWRSLCPDPNDILRIAGLLPASPS